MELAADPEWAAVTARFDRWSIDLWDGLADVYDPATVLPELVDVIASIHLSRPTHLRRHDGERTLRPDWFQASDAVGYAVMDYRSFDPTSGRWPTSRR